MEQQQVGEVGEFFVGVGTLVLRASGEVTKNF